MGRDDLSILSGAPKEPWFLGMDSKQDYPISYRYVLCHSLLNYFKFDGFDPCHGSVALKNLLSAIQNHQYYKKNNFIELLPLENEGFTVVDQADGIFPMVLYPNTRSDKDKKERIYAFKKSVEDVIDKYAKIFVYFTSNKTDIWTKEFQENLYEAAGFGETEYLENVEL